MTRSTPLIVIVTPVFEDTISAQKLFRKLCELLGDRFSIVAVDDGSVTNPLINFQINETQINGVILRLKRNLGHQRAIAVGLNYAVDRFPTSRIVIMDSDGEDSPESIPKLLAAFDQDTDIVVAQRKSRIESKSFQFFYYLYKQFFKVFTGKDINFGNFMVLTPEAAKRMVVMEELWLHLAGCVLISKLRLKRCPIDRSKRYAGKSQMNFVGLVLHGVKGLMVFAEEVFVRVGIFCACVAVVSIILMPIPLILKMIGLASPGWASILIGVFLLIFIQTGTLTLLTLLLTGLAKGRGIITLSYKDYILNEYHSQKNNS